MFFLPWFFSLQRYFRRNTRGNFIAQTNYLAKTLVLIKCRYSLMRPRKKPLPACFVHVRSNSLQVQTDILNITSPCVCRINFRPLFNSRNHIFSVLTILTFQSAWLKPQQKFNDLFGFYSPKYHIYFMT